MDKQSLQTPEERNRNINRIFAALVGISLLGLALFLAIYIPLHKGSDSVPAPASTVVSTVVVVPPSAQ